MSELENRQCPDCGIVMDIIISLQHGTAYVCSNRTCLPVNDPFDRDEDRRMEAMDIQQEMQERMKP